MALETERNTRDYLYGRLLAYADHIESKALYVAGENRDTTAMKLLQRFSDRPCATWRTIETALCPYLSRLKAKWPGYLHSLNEGMDEIYALFDPSDFESDKKLSGEFLLGFHCQRMQLHKSRSRQESEKEETEEIGEAKL